MPALARSLTLLLMCPPLLAHAGVLRDRLEERAQAKQLSELPAGSKVLREQHYGDDPRQRFDVYLPPKANGAPILFMVHGGGWNTGDKSMAAVVDNKAAHWLPRGYVLVSSNYRLVPEVTPLTQADDIARAFSVVQQQAPGWGGDPARIVLMGHSAGAHLVSLLSSDAQRAKQVSPIWLGTVALDSAAYDVTSIMQTRHYSLYDKAFGADKALWRAASPIHQLTASARPFLAVCSTLRDTACPQADAFANKARDLGVPVKVLRQNLSHRQINQQLGREPAYTAAVDAFLSQLGLP